jgi:CheY-like chemotaxis protein
MPAWRKGVNLPTPAAVARPNIARIGAAAAVDCAPPTSHANKETLRMNTSARVALVGFSAFERARLQAFFRLAERRVPGYVAADSIDDADLVLVDLDHPRAALAVAGRSARCIGVGGAPGAGMRAHVARPINMMALLRLFDTLSSGHPSDDLALDVDIAALEAANEPSAGESNAGSAPSSRVVRPASHLEEVLIVSPDEDKLRALGSFLSRFGFSMHLARSGEEALYRLPRERFDHVFLDARLTVVDALALCKLIKKQSLARGHPPPFVVLMNADGGIVDRLQARMAGFDACLSKPLRHDQLLELIAPYIVPSAATADTALAPLRTA